MQNDYIFFDIGANTASDSLHIANDPKAAVYGFEPTPYLIDIIKEKIKNVPNYILVEKAVSDFDGVAKFNISGDVLTKDVSNPEKHGWWGCSSLLSLSDSALTSWYGRTDMMVIETIEVEVIRLDTFMSANNISRIDYIHIDAQGSDLNVLRGLGKYITTVAGGVVEAANKPDILYRNQNHKDDTIRFLEYNGFKN